MDLHPVCLALALGATTLAARAQQQGQPAPAAATQPLSLPGLVWSLPAHLGQPHVALGDRGAAVFGLTSSSSVKLAMLSAFDVSPPVAIWSLSTPPGGLLDVRAAQEADVFVQTDITQVGTFSNSSSLRKYTSGSAVPDWSFDFPEVGMFLFPQVDVSRDGQVLVGAIADELTQELHVYVFGPDSGVPQARFTPSGVPGGAGALDLCEDGSTLALGTGPTSPVGPPLVHVVDLATQTTLATVPGWLPLGDAGPARGSLSDDGGRLVVRRQDPPGITWHVEVYERAGASYQRILEMATPVRVSPERLALSADGSRLAVAWKDHAEKSVVRLRVYDVATGAGTMGHTLGGPASVHNVVNGLAFSRDGTRLALGCTGDATPTTPELLVFSPDQDAPLFEFPVGGSVFELDFSPDGQRIAVGRLPDGKHVNIGWITILTQLYDLGGEDLVIQGTPRLGATVTVELFAAPGANALLLQSSGVATPALLVPGIGRLWLDRAGLAPPLPLGVVPPVGFLSAPLTLPSDPALLGTQLYLQAATSGPDALSSDFVPLTLLP